MEHHSTLPGVWRDWLGSSLADLDITNRLRSLRPLLPTTSPTEVLVPSEVLTPWLAEGGAAALPEAAEEGGALRLFSSNDYMGMSTHPAVRQAAADAALLYGMGPRSSAVVGGYTHLHAELEARLAALKGTQDCLLCPTGFAANMAVLTALCSDAGAAIFSDELNHASIIDGARLAARNKGQLHVYRHNDMEHLERLLASCQAHMRKLVVTDSLFSMDGDFADLRGLVRLRWRHGFLLAIDEAHATLVCGDRGGGAAEAFGVCGEVDIHVGTLSKAVGAHGGFVACSAALKRLLLSRGRAYIFSTAPPAPVVAAAVAALQVNEEEPARRRHLWHLVAQLGAGLGVAAKSPIVPLIIGSEAAAVAASAALLARGFYVPAIRPPTVAPGTSRLRISLSAAHTSRDVEELLDAMRTCCIIPLSHGRTEAKL